MTTEQFNELIHVIGYLGENNYGVVDFFIDILIPLGSTFIAAYAAYKVAEFQINRSEKLQRERREEGIKNQQRFMLDEMKIKNTQDFLDLTATFNTNVINMINLGRFKNDYNVETVEDVSRGESAYDPTSEYFRINLSLLECSEELQDYMNKLFTLKNLFNFNKENKTNFNTLDSKIKEHHNICNGVITSFDEEKALDTGSECIKIANEFDTLIRKELNELLIQMKGYI